MGHHTVIRLTVFTTFVITSLLASTALAAIECTSDTQHNRPGFIRFGTLDECMDAASNLNTRFGLVINEERNWESTGFYCWGKDDWPVLSLFPNKCVNQESHIAQLNMFLPEDAKVSCHDWWGPSSVIRNSTCAEAPNNREACERSCQKTVDIVRSLSDRENVVAPYAKPTSPTYREADTPKSANAKVPHKLLIVGGGTSVESAQRWRAQNVEKVNSVLHPGLNQLPLKTDGIEGLKPGFFIFEGGFCQGEDAEVHLKRAKALLPGSYIKTVMVSPDFGKCPKVRQPTVNPGPLGITLSNHSKRGCDIIRRPLFGNRVAEERVASIPGRCPSGWSVSFSRDGSRLIVITEEATYLVQDANYGSSVVRMPVKNRPLEVAYFDYETDRPVIVHSPSDGVSPQLRDGADNTQTLMFRGTEYTVDISVLAVTFCIEEHLKGEQWVTSRPKLVEFHEGYSDIYCGRGSFFGPNWTVGNWWPAWMTDTTLKTKLNVAASKYDAAKFTTDWTWVKTGSLSEGGMMVNVAHQEIGSAEFYGLMYAYDGKEVHRLEKLSGKIKGFTEIAPHLVFVCTTEGHGVFDGQTGWATYWRRGVCRRFSTQ